jgi:tetratricopeptide (TPR) repeat protein
MADSTRRESSPSAQRSRRLLTTVVGVCILVNIIILALALSHKQGPSTQPASPSRTPSANSAALEDERPVFAKYAGSSTCESCHEEQFALWQTSNHALAERRPEPKVDEPAFVPPKTFHHGTQTTAVSWTNGEPMITTVGLSGKPESLPIARIIGNDPLRQLLVRFPGGRFQASEAAWDPHSNQWFNVYGDEDRKPGEWGHWTGRGMNWNYMCASCHNTRLRRNYNEANDTYHTTMAEMSVGCEACHGPLKAHNEWQQQFGKSGKKDPTLPKISHEQVLDYCGFCHARRSDLTGDFKSGDAFTEHCDLVLVDHTDTYYADGQVRGENYEYGSFLGSKMAQRGVYCLDCHNPHSGKTILPGNFLCLRCHNGTVTNAPAIEPVSHSHHKVFGNQTASASTNMVDLLAYRPKEIQEKGGECVNCHMPQTAYMQRHWRHDHGFTIPDPLLTKEFGIPNACNRCHQDKDTDWALKACEEWYGQTMDRPTRRRAQAIARAQAGNAVRAELLELLGREESPYWKAALLGLLAPWAGLPEVTGALTNALSDTNALVRTAAARSFESALFAPGVTNALERGLADPVRSVRVAAASCLRATLAPSSQAGRDLRLYLNNNADEPSGQIQTAIWYFSRNDFSTALAHIQKAAEWDPFSAPIQQELAVVLSALNRPQEAVGALKEACRLAPKDAESHYKLGLAYNETGDLQNTVKELETAVELEPRFALAWYNLGLARNGAGQTDSALEALSRAESVDPEDPRIPYARATILARLGRAKEARLAARRALEIRPDLAEAAQLLQSLPE